MFTCATCGELINWSDFRFADAEIRSVFCARCTFDAVRARNARWRKVYKVGVISEEREAEVVRAYESTLAPRNDSD